MRALEWVSGWWPDSWDYRVSRDGVSRLNCNFQAHWTTAAPQVYLRERVASGDTTTVKFGRENTLSWGAADEMRRFGPYSSKVQVAAPQFYLAARESWIILFGRGETEESLRGEQSRVHVVGCCTTGCFYTESVSSHEKQPKSII